MTEYFTIPRAYQHGPSNSLKYCLTYLGISAPTHVSTCSWRKDLLKVGIKGKQRMVCMSDGKDLHFILGRLSDVLANSKAKDPLKYYDFHIK